MRILAIETSCDETSVAIAEFGDSRGFTPLEQALTGRARTKFGSRTNAEKSTGVRVLSHIVLSQIPLHKKFGGVVPNLARREHEKNLVPILMQALKEARFYLKYSSSEVEKIHYGKFLIPLRSTRTIKVVEKILEREPDLFARTVEYIIPLKPPPIDAISVTYGPGLAPALWVGVNFAKALAYLWNKPLMPVNHMAGHAYSALLAQNREFRTKNLELRKVKFPALALLVSGGHTELVLMKGHGRFKVIGETLDDAAGEAFDKVARILGLPYPGGPEISKLVSSYYEAKPRRVLQTKLPRPMINTKDYNFSFSGLKTAVLYLTRDLGAKKTRQLRPLIAKEFQDAAVEVLVKKTIRAAKEYKVKTILLGGGVAANQWLREKLEEEIAKNIPNTKYLIPDISFAGDNALMIATAAYFCGKKKALDTVGADANLRLN